MYCYQLVTNVRRHPQLAYNRPARAEGRNSLNLWSKSMNSNVIASLGQIFVAAPIVLVSIAGLVLAIIFWKRASTQCVLVIVSCILLCVSYIAQPGIQYWLLRSRTEYHWTGDQLALAFGISGFVFSFIRAAAVGLLLSAVFLGRSRQVVANQYNAT